MVDEAIVIKEQLLSAGKELVLELKMREYANELGEVVVKPRVNKQQPLNVMAQTGARMFSIEEANRYAGGMADPARTASVFAGVATSGATNGISIHGNFKIKTFQGQTIDLKTHAVVNQFTALTFPNIAYRIEF